MMSRVHGRRWSSPDVQELTGGYWEAIAIEFAWQGPWDSLSPPSARLPAHHQHRVRPQSASLQPPSCPSLAIIMGLRRLGLGKPATGSCCRPRAAGSRCRCLAAAPSSRCRAAKRRPSLRVALGQGLARHVHALLRPAGAAPLEHALPHVVPRAPAIVAGGRAGRALAWQTHHLEESRGGRQGRKSGAGRMRECRPLRRHGQGARPLAPRAAEGRAARPSAQELPTFPWLPPHRTALPPARRPGRPGGALACWQPLLLCRQVEQTTRLNR